MSNEIYAPIYDGIYRPIDERFFTSDGAVMPPENITDNALVVLTDNALNPITDNPD